MSFLLRFAICAMLPASDGLPGVGDLDPGAFVAKFRRDTTRLLWVTAVGCAALFMVSPLITIGVPLPAIALPAGLLDRHAAAMADHRVYLVRQAAFLIKMIGGLHWGADPTVRARFALQAYPPDPAGWRSP